MSEDIKKIKSYYTLISELKLKRDILNNNINSNLKNDYYASLDIQLKEINDSGKDAIKIQNEYKNERFNADKIICEHAALLIIAIILVFKINTLSIDSVLNVIDLKLSVILGSIGLLAVGINNLFNSCNALAKLEAKFKDVLIIKNNKSFNIRDNNLSEKINHEINKNNHDYNSAYNEFQPHNSNEDVNSQITIINDQIKHYYKKINDLLISMQYDNKEIKALLAHIPVEDANINHNIRKLSQEKSQTL